jgi:hypothetical protein
MLTWAQILDAQESANDGIRTRLTLWSLEDQRRFSVTLSGVTPLDIGHIVVIDAASAALPNSLSVLQFESLPTKMSDALVVDPVSFDPNSQRPFQDDAWRDLAKHDRPFRKKLESLPSSTYDAIKGGRLYHWCDAGAFERMVV